MLTRGENWAEAINGAGEQLLDEEQAHGVRGDGQHTARLKGYEARMTTDAKLIGKPEALDRADELVP